MHSTEAKGALFVKIKVLGIGFGLVVVVAVSVLALGVVGDAGQKGLSPRAALASNGPRGA